MVLAEGPAGYARLARAISEAQIAGEKGAPRTTIAGLATAARAAVHLDPVAERDEQLVVRAHRVSQGHGAGGARARRPRGRAPRARRARRRVRPRPRARGAVGPRRPARPSPQRRAGDGRGRAPGSTWSPPTTCTTPPPRSVHSPPRSRRSARAVRSTRSTAGSPRRRSRTCAAPASRRAGSLAGRARWSAPSTSRAPARSTCVSPRPSCPTTTCRTGTPR